MQKILKQLLFLFCLLTILILPYFVFAATPLDKLEVIQGGSGYAAATETTVSSIAGTVVASALGFLGIIFVVYMIYGGFLWMTDTGNEEQVSKAKNIIKNSIIGLIIIVSAYGIYAVVGGIFENNSDTKSAEELIWVDSDD